MMPRRMVLALATVLLLLVLALPQGVSAAVSLSLAELSGAQLRVEGGGARPNASITIDGAAMGQADTNGQFRIQKDPFSSATCSITVGDGSTTAQATLSGCTPSAPPPPPPSSGPAAPTPTAPADGASVTEPFTLSWTAVTDPSGIAAYNWQVSPSSTFSPVVAINSTSGATTSTVSGLATGAYFWRVQAVSGNAASGNMVTGAWSTARSVTVTGANAGAPGTATLNPPNVPAVHPMETIAFTWSAVPGAATYNLDAATDPNFPILTRVHFDNISTTTRSLTLGDSMPQGTWYARVTAVNASLIAGVPSNLVTFTLSFNAPLPPAPTPLTPADGAPVTLPVTFTWTDVPNPQLSGYTLEIAGDPGFGTLDYLNNQITGPQWTVTSLTAGTKYWHVRSMQGDAAPATISSSAVPALTAWSATRSFVVPSTTAVGSLALSNPTPSSGDTDTVTVQLTGPAPAGGAVVHLTSSNPTAAPLPATFTVAAGFAFGQFTFPTGQVTAATPVTLTGTLGTSSASVSLTVQPPSLQSLSVFSPITGGTATSAVLMLNGQAPAGGLSVALTSSNPALVAVPATVAIAPGSPSLSFTIPTNAVTANTVVTLTASLNGKTVQAPLTLTPQQPPASLALSPTSTIRTAGSSGTVTLAAAAPSDTQVFLTSSNPTVASVPPSVQVPQGSTTGGFSVNTSVVTAATTVTISASGAGVTKTATLTVTP